MIYARKYRTELTSEEFKNIANYVSGILGSEAYSGKTSIEEQRDEDRLTIYLEEISKMYRNNIKNKSEVRSTADRVFRQISDDLTPNLSKFRNPSNMYRVIAALAHVVNLKPEVVELVQKLQKDPKGLTATTDYLAILRTLPIKDSLKHYQSVLGSLSRLKSLSEFTGFQSFLESVNAAPDFSVITKEMKDILKKAEAEVSTLSLGTTLALVDASAKYNKGAISKTLKDSLDSKTESELKTMDRKDFYQYFLMGQFTKDPSSKVIDHYMRQKEADSSLVFHPESVKKLIKVYQALSDRSPSADMLLHELEADIQHHEASLSIPQEVPRAINRQSLDIN